MATRAERRGQLFDFAVQKTGEGKGFTVSQAADALSVSESLIRQLIPETRKILSEGGWLLPCDPPPEGAETGEYWYWLENNSQGTLRWRMERAADAAARQQSLLNAAVAHVNATDGRTREGRLARSYKTMAANAAEMAELLRDEVEMQQ